MFESYWLQLEGSSRGDVNAITVGAFLKKSQLKDATLQKVTWQDGFGLGEVGLEVWVSGCVLSSVKWDMGGGGRCAASSNRRASRALYVPRQCYAYHVSF